MDFLQSLRKRTEGFDCVKQYDNAISRIRCVHNNTPPPGTTYAPLLSCSFAKKQNNGHILANTCEDGCIIIMDTATKVDDNHPYHIQEINSNALFSVAWSDVDTKLVTGSGDHNAYLLDVQPDGKLTQVHEFKAHTCSVKTVSFKPHSSNVLATGGRDGAIYVWDARNRDGVPDQCIVNGHFRKQEKRGKCKNCCEPSITCVIFQDEYRLISCTDTDPCIKIWDLRKTYMRCMQKPAPAFQIIPKNNITTGYSHMVINKSGTRVFANNRNSTIYCYNVSSYSSELEHCYTGYQSRSFYVKCCLSPDEQYLASTGNDDKVFIWRINVSEKPVIMLEGSPAGLSDISWCPEDELKLATSSDNPIPWIWSVLPEQSFMQEGIKPPGFAVRLSNPIKLPNKCRTTSAMAANLTKYTLIEETELSKIALPNAVVDGTYQTHTCQNYEMKLQSPSVNWLTNLHNQQAKPVSPKQVKRLSVRNRVSPKVIKSPSTQTKKGAKILKRKRLLSSPGHSDLTKYFKTSDENRFRT